VAAVIWPPGEAARRISRTLWPNDPPQDHILCKADLDQMTAAIVVVHDWDEVHALADALRQPHAYPNIQAIVTYNLPNLALGELINMLIQRRARQEKAPELYMGLQSQLSDITRARPVNLEVVQPLIASISRLEEGAVTLASHLPPLSVLQRANGGSRMVA